MQDRKPEMKVQTLPVSCSVMTLHAEGGAGLKPEPESYNVQSDLILVQL